MDNDVEGGLFAIPTYILSLVSQAESAQSTKKLRRAGLFRKAAEIERGQSRGQPTQPKLKRQTLFPQAVETVPTPASKVKQKSSAEVAAWQAHTKLCEYRQWCRERGVAMDPAAAGYFAREDFPPPSRLRGRPSTYAVLSDQIRCAASIYRAEIDGQDTGRAAGAIAAKLGRRRSFAVKARAQFSDEECRAQLGLSDG